MILLEPVLDAGPLDEELRGLARQRLGGLEALIERGEFCLGFRQPLLQDDEVLKGSVAFQHA